MQIDECSWDSMGQTSFRPFVEAGNKIPDGREASAPELAELETLLESTDISASSLEVYQQVLERLKGAYQAQSMNTDGSYATAISSIFAWPILAPSEYTDLLMQRRPEALAILAHYAVLLHHHRNVWIFGNGGRSLIESISKYLGAYWTKWLSLPISVLNSSPQESAASPRFVVGGTSVLDD